MRCSRFIGGLGGVGWIGVVRPNGSRLTCVRQSVSERQLGHRTHHFNMSASPVVVSSTESEEASMHALVHQSEGEVFRSRVSRLEVASCDDTAPRIVLPVSGPMVLNAKCK